MREVRGKSNCVVTKLNIIMEGLCRETQLDNEERIQINSTLLDEGPRGPLWTVEIPADFLRSKRLRLRRYES